MTSPTAAPSHCDPEIAVVTNIELDHHAFFASEAELQDAFTAWLAGVPDVVRSWELEPVTFELAIAGEHNRQNAAAALAALSLAGIEPAVAADSARAVCRRRSSVPVRRRTWRRAGLRRLRAQPDRASGHARDRSSPGGGPARRRLSTARLRAHPPAPPRARCSARSGRYRHRHRGDGRTRCTARRDDGALGARCRSRPRAAHLGADARGCDRAGARGRPAPAISC